MAATIRTRANTDEAHVHQDAIKAALDTLADEVDLADLRDLIKKIEDASTELQAWATEALRPLT